MAASRRAWIRVLMALVWCLLIEAKKANAGLGRKVSRSGQKASGSQMSGDLQSGRRKSSLGGSSSSRRKRLDDQDNDDLDDVSSALGGRKKSAGDEFGRRLARAPKGAGRRYQALDDLSDEDPYDDDDEDLDDDEEAFAPKRRASRLEYTDDEDENEDDEDEFEPTSSGRRRQARGGRGGRASSGKPTKGKGAKQGKKGKGGRYAGNSKALAYQPAYQVVREPLQARMMRNVYFLSEKVQGIAAKGKKMTREFKEYFSGDFESMLLKATRPDDQRPPEEYIGAILDATETFHRDEDVTSNTNPYRVTLRKLWAKMAEKDWRTALKALYIFHVLLRECEPDDVRIYKKIYSKMGKEVSRKTKSRYFDANRVNDVDAGQDAVADAGIDRRAYVQRYSKYVLQRAKTFTSKFEEMKVIGERDIVPKDLVGQLGKAEKVLTSGLECALEPEEESEITLMCTELVARDVYDLFRLFHDKLRWVVDHEAEAFEGADPVEVNKILDKYKASYQEKYPKVQTFLTTTAELLSVYGIKLRTKLESMHAFNEDDKGDDGDVSDKPSEAAASIKAEGGVNGEGSSGADTQHEAEDDDDATTLEE